MDKNNDKKSLNNIRIAHMTTYVGENRPPISAKGSNYGNADLAVGYVEGDVFTTKSGEQFRICGYKYVVDKKASRMDFELAPNKLVFDKKLNDNEIFARILNIPLTTSRECISNNKMGLLLDYIEKEIYHCFPSLNGTTKYTSIINDAYKKVQSIK